MNRKSLHRRYAGIGLILLFSMACSTLFTPPTPTPVPPTHTPLPTATATATPTATPLPNYDGIWKGTTSQDKPISLTVEDNRVTFLEIEVDMQGNGCTTNVKTTFNLKAPIAEAAFETSTDSADTKHVIKAKFDSETSVSGSIYYSQSQGCPGDVETQWSATKAEE